MKRFRSLLKGIQNTSSPPAASADAITAFDPSTTGPVIQHLDLSSVRRYVEPGSRSSSPRDISPRFGVETPVVIRNEGNILTPRNSGERSVVKLDAGELLIDAGLTRGSTSPIRSCRAAVCFHNVDLFIKVPGGAESVWRFFPHQSSLAIACCIKMLGGDLTTVLGGHFSKHVENLILDTRSDLLEEDSSSIVRETQLYFVSEETTLNNAIPMETYLHRPLPALAAVAASSSSSLPSPERGLSSPSSSVDPSPREWVRLDSPMSSPRSGSSSSSSKDSTPRDQKKRFFSSRQKVRHSTSSFDHSALAAKLREQVGK